MEIIEQIHQGDVLFLKLAQAIPTASLKALPSNDIEGTVVQHGEGLHSHVIPARFNTFKAFMVGEQDSVKEIAINVKETVEVIHDEHNPIALTPGFWIARTQRESSRGIFKPVID